MRCKEILTDGTVCNTVSKDTSYICWTEYGMCGRCCKQKHPEAYAPRYPSVTHFVRELRKGDPELDKSMSSDVTITKWSLGDK